MIILFSFFFFNDTATTEIYTLSLHDALPICVAESSGYPALDSAALGGAKKLRFAPARRQGVRVAAAFRQPIEFRHPGASGAVIRGAPDTALPATARPAPPPAPPPRRIRQDTGRAPLDTTRVRAETTRAKPDSGAVAH